MHSRLFAGIITLALAAGGCTLSLSRMNQAVPMVDSPLLLRILSEPEFSTIAASPEQHRLQIILTQVDTFHGKPRLTHHAYRLRPREYFYPASLVKLPTALLALEKLHSIPRAHRIDLDTPYEVTQTSCENIGEQAEPGRRPTIRDDILLSLIFSDNKAFDRLFSWTGPGYLTETLRARGFSTVQITHRLGSRCSPYENRLTHPVTFFPGQNGYLQGPSLSETYHAPADDTDLVTGYPGDLRSFGQLSDFHWMTIAALLPEAVEPQARFRLNDEELRIVADALSRSPEEYQGPTQIDRSAWPGSPMKFLLMGASKERIPPGLRIFSKTGKALGFLSESGLFLDVESGTAFFLSATVYVNYRRSGDDSDHHYDDLGLPFLRRLGSRIMEQERTRGEDVSSVLRHLWPRTETRTSHEFQEAAGN